MNNYAENKIDVDFLKIKYSDYYNSDSFVLYDLKKYAFPVYKLKLNFCYTKSQILHPIIIKIMEIIKYIDSISDRNISTLELLYQVTQMDREILGSIISSLKTKGYLKDDNLNIMLSNKGQKVLDERKELKVEEAIETIYLDGIFGNVLDDNSNYRRKKDDIKNAIELKPNGDKRPRMERIYDEYSNDKTLFQVLNESLMNLLNSKEENDFELKEIKNLEVNKCFRLYWCLFYKNTDEDEKILVLDDEFEVDNEATKTFDDLISIEAKTGKSLYDSFIDKTSGISLKLNEENSKLFKQKTPDIVKQNLEITIQEGHVIEMVEHKMYLKYVLDNAKSEIYIQSPWIKWDVLKMYEDNIKNALKRKVHIYISYGMKRRNRFDKPAIDDMSRNFLLRVNPDFLHLNEKECNHSKVLICDSDFLITGSFNWLSYPGEEVGDNREEFSTITTNKDSINKLKKTLSN